MMTPAFAAFVAASMLGRAQGFVPDLPARPGPEEEVSTEPRASAAVAPELAAQAGGPGEIGFFAAGADTVRTPPAPPSEGAKTDEPAPVVLKRGTALAAAAVRRGLSDRSVGWDVEMVGRLKRPTVRGAVLVTVYDASDKEALARREVTSLWSFILPKTAVASVRVRLDEDGGYRAGREYLVRFVQLLGRRESVLAEGRVRLE